MRFNRLMILCLLALVGGCVTEDGNGISKGTPITHVQFEYGMPDVISDASGDLTRYYQPTSRPAEEWPGDAPRTFYYLKHDLAVTFVYGKVVSTQPIDPAIRDKILLPLVQPRSNGSR